MKIQLTRVVTAGLLIIGPFTVAWESKSYVHCPDQIGSLQAEPKNRPPIPPAILPGHSGSTRRGVCRREAVKTAQPIYPTEAEKEGIKGAVVVEIIIDEKGRVDLARSLSGPVALRSAAVEAARKWRFRVTLVAGKPVRIACTLSFSFPPMASHTKKTRGRRPRHKT